MEVALPMWVSEIPALLWLVAALVPVLVAIRCGQVGLPGRGLVLSQLLLAGWCVATGALRLVEATAPGLDALAAVSVASVAALALARLEGVGVERWRRLLVGSLVLVGAAGGASLVPGDAPGSLHWGGGLVVLCALALVSGATVMTVAPRLRALAPRRLAEGLGTGCFAAPVVLAVGTLPFRGEVVFEPLAFLPASLFLGWLLAPTSTATYRASASVDPVLVVEYGSVVDANPSAYRLLGAHLGDLHGLRRAIHGLTDLRRIIFEEGRECGEFFIGEDVATRQCFEVRVDRSEASGGATRILTLRNAMARDESDRHHQAQFDSLTGIENRRQLVSRMAEAIDARDAQDEGRVALLCLDLDRFKEVNETYGQAAGDELLRIMAHRLRQHLRLDDLLGHSGQMASPCVARLGGDEFSILLPGIVERDDVERVAERILMLVSEPVTLKGRRLWVAGSLGIAFYPDDGDSLEEVSAHAEVALYHAKAERRSDYQFYHPSLSVETLRKASIDRQLRGAIEEGELSLHFQPKVAVEGEHIHGAEALLRWNSAEHGPVPPREFIPIAEEYGLIGTLGAWVIESTCAQIAAWRDQGLSVLPISVNVSPVQFRQMNLMEVIGAALERHQVEPGLLEIELTESAVLEEGDTALACLRQLRTIGVRVALDDFGTGYSALSYLSTMPLDFLKLDRKFIRDIHLDPAAQGVVTGVVSMAHSLGLQVVAEGVDCKEQIESLIEANCDLLQGFVFGPGVSAEEFGEMLEWGIYGRPRSAAPRLGGSEEGEVVETGDAAREVAPEPSRQPPAQVEAGLELHDRRVLVVGRDDDEVLELLALRLNRLGIHAMYSHDAEEALLCTDEVGSRIGALVASSAIERGALEELVRRASEHGDDATLVFVGGEPGKALVELGSAAGVWSLNGPILDSELRSVFIDALTPLDGRARRGVARAAYNLMAHMEASGERRSGVLSSLSGAGCFVACDPVPAGALVDLSFELEDGPVEVVGKVIYSLGDDALQGAGIGLEFRGVTRDLDERLSASIAERATRCLV